VKSTSYILSTAIGGSVPGSKAAKVVRKGAPLWDPAKLATGQFFSQTQYYNVTGVAGDRVTVQNQYGNMMHVSKDILEKMSSATHFMKETPMTMTALADLLSSVSDTIFTVQFRKQVDPKDVEQVVKDTKLNDLKDKAKIAAIVKQVTEGEPCTMICHLVNAENNLGRSTVIDLSAPGDNKFRQIDHRTIESITFNNVKYVLKKGGKKEEPEEEEKKGAPKWDTSKLAVGNWFSGTSYF